MGLAAVDRANSPHASLRRLATRRERRAGAAGSRLPEHRWSRAQHRPIILAGRSGPTSAAPWEDAHTPQLREEPMPSAITTFRVFVSSTFGDMVRERGVLQ